MTTNERIEEVLAELVAMESAWFTTHPPYRDVDVYESILKELMPAAQQDGN